MRRKIAAFALIALLAASGADAQTASSPLDSVRAALQRADWAGAKTQLDALVQRRDPRAIALLGDLHYPPGGTGDFVEDPESACSFYERAAGLNSPDGMFGLGRCFAEGRGRPQDPVEARVLFERAGEKGSIRAWCASGQLYLDGAGVTANSARGVALCRQGSSMGDSDADAELGMRYLQGRGVPKSFGDARPWLERAAQRGNAAAARALSQAYASGDGVPRDRVQAANYREQAAKAGDVDAASQIVSERVPLLMQTAPANADRRLVVDTMYWLAVVAQLHPDQRKREIAKFELGDLRTRFPAMTMDADFRLEKEPPRRALPR